MFGIDPASVADTLQHLVQASSVLHDVPGAKERQLVQIQGNQVHHVGKLLLGKSSFNRSDQICSFTLVHPRHLFFFLFCFISEQYQIPRKYIQGLDKAPKPGKKK